MRIFGANDKFFLCEMNGIDICVALVLAWAVFAGWRRGAVLQLFSLAGIVGGIWLGVRYGAEAGRALGFCEELVRPGGFAVVLVAVMLVVGLLGQLLRRLFRFAGLGPLDVLLGIALSAAKWLLVLGVAFILLQRFDSGHTLIGERTAERSLAYGPLCRLSERVLPFFERYIEPLASFEAEEAPVEEKVSAEEDTPAANGYEWI